MAGILHFEILRKHGQTNTQTNTQTNKQTHKQTHKHTDMGITIPRPPPMGGEVIRPSAAQSVNDDTSNASSHESVDTSILSGVNDGALSGENKTTVKLTLIDRGMSRVHAWPVMAGIRQIHMTHKTGMLKLCSHQLIL